MTPTGILRKDAPPAETIERIRDILDALGFHRHEERVHWNQAFPDCHSCRVRFANYPVIGANGKGLTRELALASALAEFIERLQGYAEAYVGQAGHIFRFPPIVPTRARRVAEIEADAPGLLSPPGAPPLRADMELPCRPFVDLWSGRVVDLPYEALLSMTASNGMASGNSPAEALCHGLCEVFERRAIRAVHSGEVPGLPTLPLELFDISDARIARLVRSIRDAGVEVTVKDASLGGVIPVLAVALADRQRGTCSVSFGSDPVAEVALSRCLTEAFQGLDRLAAPLPSSETAKPSLDIYNDVEMLFDRILEDRGQSSGLRAFLPPASNRELLAALLARAAAHGQHVYARDVSLFGFPACYVHVDRMSPLFPAALGGLNAATGLHDEVRTTLFRIQDMPPERIAWVARTLFTELTGQDGQLETGFGTMWLRAPILTWMGLRPLLAFLLISSGQYEEAQVVLSWPRPSSREPGLEFPAGDLAAGFRQVLSDYCDLRRRGVDNGIAAAQLERSHAGSAPGRNVRALVAGDYAAFVHGGAPRAGSGFRGLAVPRCANVYCCAGCECRRYCYLDGWRRLALAARRQARAIPADSLSDHAAQPGAALTGA